MSSEACPAAARPVRSDPLQTAVRTLERSFSDSSDDTGLFPPPPPPSAWEGSVFQKTELLSGKTKGVSQAKQPPPAEGAEEDARAQKVEDDAYAAVHGFDHASHLELVVAQLGTFTFPGCTVV